MTRLAAILRKIASNRWVAAVLLCAAILLLTLVALTFDHRSSPLPRLVGRHEPIDRIVPVSRIERLTASLTAPIARFFSGGAHPFFTTYFKPPPPPVVPDPTPVPAPTPPPPPPKKVALFFHGVYQSADGQDRAFLKVDDHLSILPLGEVVVRDWRVAEIGRQKLTLTNAAAQMTVLEFNREKIIEVPAE